MKILVRFSHIFIVFMGFLFGLTPSNATIYTKQLHFEPYVPSQDVINHKKRIAKEAGFQVIQALKNSNFSMKCIHDFSTSSLSYFQPDPREDRLQSNFGIFLTSHFTSQGQFPIYTNRVFSPDWIDEKWSLLSQGVGGLLRPESFFWMISLQDGAGVSLHLAHYDKSEFERHQKAIKTLFGVPQEIPLLLPTEEKEEDKGSESEKFSIVDQLLQGIEKLKLRQKDTQ